MGIGWFSDRARLLERSNAGQELARNIEAHLGKDGKLEMDVSVAKRGDVLSLWPTYGERRGNNGELIGVQLGGHAKFELSNRGEVTQFISGR